MTVSVIGAAIEVTTRHVTDYHRFTKNPPKL